MEINFDFLTNFLLKYLTQEQLTLLGMGIMALLGLITLFTMFIS